jgi:beta-galactosidase
VDGLTVTDGEVLAAYEHPHFGRWPAVTSRRHGEGRVTCVGTVPGRDLARALAEWLTPAARSGWGDLPASVTATTGTSPDGRRVHIVHNWSWEPARSEVPADLVDALDDTSLPAGTVLELGPWDVRVLVSAQKDSQQDPKNDSKE